MVNLDYKKCFQLYEKNQSCDTFSCFNRNDCLWSFGTQSPVLKMLSFFWAKNTALVSTQGHTQAFHFLQLELAHIRTEQLHSPQGKLSLHFSVCAWWLQGGLSYMELEEMGNAFWNGTSSSREKCQEGKRVRCLMLSLLGGKIEANTADEEVCPAQCCALCEHNLAILQHA